MCVCMCPTLFTSLPPHLHPSPLPPFAAAQGPRVGMLLWRAALLRLELPDRWRLQQFLAEGWASPRHLPGVTGDPPNPAEGEGGMPERDL